MTPSTQHAIVYGGSMVGLVTAGVLARHFSRVTVVERDRYENAPQARKGVPQSQHVHGLLTHGLNLYRSIFPQLDARLTAAGGELFDAVEPHAWCSDGVWYPRFHSGLNAYGVSRPLLEWVVREQLKALPQVHLRDGREVTGLLTSPDRSRVTGIHLQAPGGGEAETLEGALVVDCSGRGSRAPQWLEALGYPRVEETRIRIDVAYVSRVYRKPRGFSPGWRNLSLSPKLPRERRFGIIQEIEGDRWLVLLGGWLGEAPQCDEADFLSFARRLAQPHLYEAIRGAEPLGPIHRCQFPHNQWRHYEKLARFPEGLVIAGDAFCSFNPIYGQGMTTGAMQAELLGQCLREGHEGVATRYRQRVGKMLQSPWSLSTSGDLRLPEVEGKRSPLAGVMNWYSDRLQWLTSQDPPSLVTLLRVMHMVEPPSALFSPRMLLKLLVGPRRAPAALAPPPTSSARPAAVSPAA